MINRASVSLLCMASVLLVLEGCHFTKSTTKYDYLLKDKPATAGSPAPASSGTPAAAPTTTLSSKEVNEVIREATSYIGTPYKYGGLSRKGLDCSGLVYVSFQRINRTLPRSSGGLYAAGKQVSRNRIQPGDLVFFDSNLGGKVNHVGLVTSVNGAHVEFIHASTSKGVRKDFLDDDYWDKRFKGARAL